ncbi:hypothetical protein [Phytohabitans kaempferiae]|uniref:Uncharacterized protein n=1 Tax=Phytohabitans kaempferiae TaxID=1620943 RepID=A0ABV6M836_9ACTN
MRGGLDDALERLARMDQLRRRAEGTSGSLPTAHGLAEAIEAVRRVVERHPDLNITLYGEQGEGSAEVRIGWEDGVVRAKIVSVEGPEGAAFGPSDGPMPVLPAEIPPMSDLPRPITDGSRARVEAYPAAWHPEPSPMPEPRLADRRRRRTADAGFLPDQGLHAEPRRPAEAEFLPEQGGLHAEARRAADGGLHAEARGAAEGDFFPEQGRGAEPRHAAGGGFLPDPGQRFDDLGHGPRGHPLLDERRAGGPGFRAKPSHAADAGVLPDAGRATDPVFRPEPSHAADAGFLPDPGGLAPAEPTRGGEPPRLAAPRAWTAETDDNAAARLAAMIREDPSLLASPDDL